MKRIIAIIMAFFVWAFIGFVTFLAFIAIAISRVLDRKDRFTYRLANLWGQLIANVNPLWKVKITGAHHIKNNRGYVIVANHTSLGDIVCLFCLGKHFKWVAKSSLFKIPFFGWSMSLLRYISLSRGRHGSIRDSFNEAIDCLERDISVLIFPEGTRSKSGRLAEFKNGAFKLALITKKPIVPVVISGTGEAISKGRATFAATVTGSLKVLPPIEVDHYKESDYEPLKMKVWNLMNEELTEARH